jgi:hypothetical protein
VYSAIRECESYPPVCAKSADRRYGWTLYRPTSARQRPANAAAQHGAWKCPRCTSGRLLGRNAVEQGWWAESVCKADSVSHGFCQLRFQSGESPQQGSISRGMLNLMNIRISVIHPQSKPHIPQSSLNSSNKLPTLTHTSSQA